MVVISGKKYRDLKSDSDKITIKGHQIGWRKRQNRYVIRRKGKQIYDTAEYDTAVRWVVRNTK